MTRILKREKKNVVILLLLSFILGVLMVSAFQAPLLAGTAYCSDGECTCSCSGSDCSCTSGSNSCSCYCSPNSYHYCNKSGGKIPDEI